MSDSMQNKYVVQVFRGQLDHYAPHESRLSEEEVPIPPGLSKRDQEVLLSVRKGYHFLDETFHIFGIYFGWSFIFGFFFPVFGPAIEFVLSYKMIIKRAERAGIPKWLKSEMMMNIMFGTALCFIPFAGRILVALFGPNTRNEKLLEEYMRVRGDMYVKLRGMGPLEEKPEGDEWWTVLCGKAEGITRRDAEQVQPGAGMTVEDI